MLEEEQNQDQREKLDIRKTRKTERAVSARQP